jgi:hypothetical protein
VNALSGLSLHSAFELSLKGIHRPKGQLSRGIHVSYARLKLQKILPGAIHVGLRTGFVTHADEHSLPSLEIPSDLYTYGFVSGLGRDEGRLPNDSVGPSFTLALRRQRVRQGRPSPNHAPRLRRSLALPLLRVSAYSSGRSNRQP